MAVQHALTAAEIVQFMDSAIRRFPGFEAEGVTPADVLDYTTEYDAFLGVTEPFFEKFGAQMPQDVRLSAVLHAVILLDRELTPGRVWSVLQRAGMVDPPRYPDVEAGLLAEGSYRDWPDDVNHLMVKARAEQGMRAAGVPEHEITEFRNSVRATGIPGYGQNMADIAKWVTLVDRFTPLPRKVYDPTDDIAVVLMASWDFRLANGRTPPELAGSLANLRSHLDMRTAETIKSSLLTAYGRTPE
jgi:hypothetical protein